MEKAIGCVRVCHGLCGRFLQRKLRGKWKTQTRIEVCFQPFFCTLFKARAKAKVIKTLYIGSIYISAQRPEEIHSGFHCAPLRPLSPQPHNRIKQPPCQFIQSSSSSRHYRKRLLILRGRHGVLDDRRMRSQQPRARAAPDLKALRFKRGLVWPPAFVSDAGKLVLLCASLRSQFN